VSNERYSRQSFLGPDAQECIQNTVIGIVGLGGGGSHILQQLAHVGFQHYVLYDPDQVEDSNLNRMVGATERDMIVARPKVKVALRIIRGLQPEALIETYPKRWQEEPLPLRGCDLIFGCVDGLGNRRDLEATARRYLIPYIDIGLDVHQVGTELPIMAGQVVLSMPGNPCMRCLGVLQEQALAQEGRRYGDAGLRPQVIWANGVLASTAVGIAIVLLTDWTHQLRHPVYLQYFGNEGTIQPSPRLEFAAKTCKHYPITNIGDPEL
jgi:molybdopterin-synthase adenylyltransferase